MSSQTLDRAVALLRLLASAPDGARLIDLQRQTGLTKPTVHRLLDSLCEHDLATQDESSRRYLLGPELGQLAAAARPAGYDLLELCRNHMIEVAQRTGDTSFLTVRSGYDQVCIDRQSGSYPVKAFTVDVGTRRPLGVGAGGIVLLLTLDEDERERVYQTIEQSLTPQSSFTLKAIRSGVEQCRKHGFAYSDGLVLGGVRGVAVPIRGPGGKTIAALSVAAIKDRIPKQRVPRLLSILQTHAVAVEGRVRDAGAK